jgi:NAD(P)-dependent dehydrogenase (short-subunit alcohol dehydrogenase family)
MSTSPSKGVAIVTGAAQGIGRAIAIRLADDFDVAVNDISNSQALDSVVAEIIMKGRRSLTVVADISDEDQVIDMIDTVVNELGGLNVVRAALLTHSVTGRYTLLRWLPMRGSIKRCQF